MARLSLALALPWEAKAGLQVEQSSGSVPQPQGQQENPCEGTHQGLQAGGQRSLPMGQNEVSVRRKSSSHPICRGTPSHPRKPLGGTGGSLHPQYTPPSVHLVQELSSASRGSAWGHATYLPHRRVSGWLCRQCCAGTGEAVCLSSAPESRAPQPSPPRKMVQRQAGRAGRLQLVISSLT